MQFRNCAIYLMGFPGVGKLTIANEICRQADFRLLDNHSINNLIFKLIRVDGSTKMPAEVWEATRKIRKVVLDAWVELGNPDFNFVLTNAIYEDDPDDLKIYRSIERVIAKRNGCFIPVTLLCNETENRKRISSPERDSNLKQTVNPGLQELHRDRRPYQPRHSNSFVIDVSNLNALEAARMILNHVSKISAKPGQARSGPTAKNHIPF